jgi:hypothetical protein
MRVDDRKTLNKTGLLDLLHGYVKGTLIDSVAERVGFSYSRIKDASLETQLLREKIVKEILCMFAVFFMRCACSSLDKLSRPDNNHYSHGKWCFREVYVSIFNNAITPLITFLSPQI